MSTTEAIVTCVGIASGAWIVVTLLALRAIKKIGRK